jgi:hypothetical protein
MAKARRQNGKCFRQRGMNTKKARAVKKAIITTAIINRETY